MRGRRALQSLFWAFSLLLVAGISETANACSVRATYRSVVLNTVPDRLPPDANLFRVRVEEALYDAARNEIQGVRGVLVESGAQLSVGSKIQIMGRLPFCETWYEHWSRDHDIKDGVLTGYVVGRVIGVIGDSTVLKPVLFRMKEDRGFRGNDSHWMHEQMGPMTEREMRRFNPAADANWMPLRVNLETLIADIQGTDRLIQEGVKQLRND